MKKIKKKLLAATLLLGTGIASGGCNAFQYKSQYGLDHKYYEKTVWVGSGLRTVGAIVGEYEVITVAHHPAVNNKKLKTERVLRTLGGSIFNPWIHIYTGWEPKRINKDLDIALLKSDASLDDYEPLEIGDAKLGECLIISLNYINIKGTKFIPFDRKGKITALPDKNTEIIKKGGIRIKPGRGEVVLKKPETTQIIPGILEWRHDPEDILCPGDSGSLILQNVDEDPEYELVGILTARNWYKSNTGYFTRGSELEKLLKGQTKPSKEWKITLPEYFK